MDQTDLGVARYDAGLEYLAAIRRLHLEPEACFWAYDRTVAKIVLVIVTSLFDYAGPLALTRLLFDAYNAAATPREIDPFILRLHSPKHAIYRAARSLLGTRIDLADFNGRALDRATVAGDIAPFAVASFRAGDLESFGTWVYKSGPASKAKPLGAARRWKQFESTVHAVAA